MDTSDILCETTKDPFHDQIQKEIYTVGAYLSRMEQARNSILSFVSDKINHDYDTFSEQYMTVAVMLGGGAKIILKNVPIASPVTFNLVLERVNSTKRGFGLGCFVPGFELVSEMSTELLNFCKVREKKLYDEPH